MVHCHGTETLYEQIHFDMFARQCAGLLFYLDCYGKRQIKEKMENFQEKLVI